MDDQIRKDADIGRDKLGGKYGTEAAEGMSTFQAQADPRSAQPSEELRREAERLGKEAAQQGPNTAGMSDQIDKDADIGRDRLGGQYGTEAAQAVRKNA